MKKQAAKKGSGLKYSTDGGLTWHKAKNEIRIIYENQPVPGEDRNGELHVVATHEGLIMDVWVTREQHLDHNIGTSSEMASEIVQRLAEENQ